MVERTIMQATGLRGRWRRQVFTENLLPYGMLKLQDEREVLFNRNYKWLWQRWPGRPAELAQDDGTVAFMDRTWFYEEPDGPWDHIEVFDECMGILDAWNVPRPVPDDIAAAMARLAIEIDGVFDERGRRTLKSFLAPSGRYESRQPARISQPRGFGLDRARI